jgi:hypothetical protein
MEFDNCFFTQILSHELQGIMVTALLNQYQKKSNFVALENAKV